MKKGEDKILIENLTVRAMKALLKKETKGEIILDDTIEQLVLETKKREEYSDCITFREVVEGIREGLLKEDTSFPAEGWDSFLKVLGIGTPEYMARHGIVFLSTSFAYPQQFLVREYHPEPPEGADDGFFYPHVAVVLELSVGRGEKKGKVFFHLFPPFKETKWPKDMYVPRKYRKNFVGSWEECIHQYLFLIDMTKILAIDAIKKSRLGRTRMF